MVLPGKSFRIVEVYWFPLVGPWEAYVTQPRAFAVPLFDDLSL
jgi:hypothetical protein